MSLSVEAIRERSRKRKKLLAQQLGVGSVESLREVLRSREDLSGRGSSDYLVSSTSTIKSTGAGAAGAAAGGGHKNHGSLLNHQGIKKLSGIKKGRGGGSSGSGLHRSASGKGDRNKVGGGSSSSGQQGRLLTSFVAIKSEESPADVPPQLYTDSSTFLKGTQSSNPHNDYCQHFVDTGQRPQNFIRDTGLTDRFEEYPKLKELIRLKDELIQETASPPMYLKTDLSNFHLGSLPVKFDVILIEPPLEEYQRTRGVTGGDVDFWGWDQIMSLDIPSIAAPRSFLFLWCGSSEGLDMGRICLRRWGFRRCEDICWIRTNALNPGQSKNLEPKAVFQRTKEHCLMGIKGTVRRSTDGDFIHANVDIDLIITEEEEYGSMEKPTEIFNIIEHFCLGRRRLHLFGRDSTIRPGWLTIGPQLTNDNFNADTYSSYFAQGSITTGCTERIESLRPKSPPPKAGNRSFRGRPR